MSFTQYQQATARLQRSELAVPGSSPHMFIKASESADVFSTSELVTTSEYYKTIIPIDELSGQELILNRASLKLELSMRRNYQCYTRNGETMALEMEKILEDFLKDREI